MVRFKMTPYHAGVSGQYEKTLKQVVLNAIILSIYVLTNFPLEHPQLSRSSSKSEILCPIRVLNQIISPEQNFSVKRPFHHYTDLFLKKMEKYSHSGLV